MCFRFVRQDGIKVLVPLCCAGEGVLQSCGARQCANRSHKHPDTYLLYYSVGSGCQSGLRVTVFRLHATQRPSQSPLVKNDASYPRLFGSRLLSAQHPCYVSC